MRICVGRFAFFSRAPIHAASLCGSCTAMQVSGPPWELRPPIHGWNRGPSSEGAHASEAQEAFHHYLRCHASSIAKTSHHYYSKKSSSMSTTS